MSSSFSSGFEQLSIEEQIKVLQEKQAELQGSSAKSTTNAASVEVEVVSAEDASAIVVGPTEVEILPSKTIISPYTSRILLTTYPSQHSISPFPLSWSHPDPLVRGPIIVSRSPSSIGSRNALGAHSGSYSYYKALAVAMGDLTPDQRVSFEGTRAPESTRILETPVEGWSKCDEEGKPETSKIVSFDPIGHLVPFLKFPSASPELDIRPSIAVTRAHITLSEIDHMVAKGELSIDGTYLKRAPGASGARGQVEIAVSKAAIEPVWYLPGLAHRFGVPEKDLRRALFESTGGSYPELITRPDIKVFLPPIGGLTVYIIGQPQWLRDSSKKVTLRVHDECNGSDVFGSDICTCKPYLVYAIAECVKAAQSGNPGLVIYFRKEGRALGEVTKYLVYNLRKSQGDTADQYFRSTELVAGVRDMRFQSLMPDVLHWLGVQRVSKMISMSDMKYNAITKSGIPIDERVDLPEEWIPEDGKVEIGAKIAAGYFTSGKAVGEEDLKDVKGRGWEELVH